MLKAWRFLGAMPPDRPVGDHVALVYALGNIIDGDGDGVLGARQEIASHTLVAALRALTADDHVKAVVLRIDSGGGSAQASELIWRAVADLKAKKPVVVSMSDVAASGGYYIASGATKIFALDDTLTGSIGVVAASWRRATGWPGSASTHSRWAGQAGHDDGEPGALERGRALGDPQLDGGGVQGVRRPRRRGPPQAAG